MFKTFIAGCSCAHSLSCSASVRYIRRDKLAAPTLLVGSYVTWSDLRRIFIQDCVQLISLHASMTHNTSFPYLHDHQIDTHVPQFLARPTHRLEWPCRHIFQQIMRVLVIRLACSVKMRVLRDGLR
ncbi:hypothetical protein IE81DRAFT_140108 [Ceraceosorus guamensis]|uniref:Uncharacterized protein n=1 Tax=Ceraceosorus guamensis TaxID=1522189 RepID=A0A316VXM1_9BASI|nr:hypothetical protein IE81DRAFT_140108 [Ceraceosorus guamensis]PWN42202.1 hypothetical protein IE81DRAFT_140108 [Ceraceosorus guamensis]